MHHTRAFFLITSSFMALLSGCVNIMAEKPQIETATDPIQYADQFMAAAEKGLVNPYNLVPVFISDKGDHQVFHRFVCANPGAKKEFQYGIKRVCKNMKGWMLENGFWCRDEQSGQPLFMARSTEGTILCGSGKSLAVTVWAPSKNMSPTDPNWLTYAKAYGFEEAERPKHKLALEDLLDVDLDEGAPRPSSKYVDFSVQMTTFGPQVWNLTLNKTRVEDLPRDCFFQKPIEIPTDDFDSSNWSKGFTLNINSFGNDGGLDTHSTDKIARCYGPKIKDVYMGFTNGVLTKLSFSAPTELKLQSKILSALAPLRKTEERIDTAAYEGEGFFLRWNKALPTKGKAQQQWDSFFIQSHQPKFLAEVFFQKHGYPKHGPMEFERSTKKSLASFMRNHNFVQRGINKSDDSRYFAALKMFPIDGNHSNKQLTVGYWLNFHKQGTLKSVEIQFSPTLTRREVASLLGRNFVYIGKSDPFFIYLDPNAEKLGEYVYWHKDYTPKKTGSHALFTAHVYYGVKTGRIYSIRLSSLPNDFI